MAPRQKRKRRHQRPTQNHSLHNIVAQWRIDNWPWPWCSPRAWGCWKQK